MPPKRGDRAIIYLVFIHFWGWAFMILIRVVDLLPVPSWSWKQEEVQNFWKRGIWCILMESHVTIFENHFSSSKLFSPGLCFKQPCDAMLDAFQGSSPADIQGDRSALLFLFCSTRTSFMRWYLCLLIYLLSHFLYNKILILS
jgi:hypothetical protein